MKKKTHLMTGLALGASAMYLLDPNRGKKRRATLRDRFGHLSRQSAQLADVSTRDLANRMEGVVAETRSTLRRKRLPTSDAIIEERIRSRLGRIVSHPHAIHVISKQGHVTLTGLILTQELEPLIHAVFKVPGVIGIHNHLEPHLRDDHLPSLQGGIPRIGRRMNLLQTQWAPGTRLLMGALGTASLSYGMNRRDRPGALIATAGLLVVSRSLINLPVRTALGLDANAAVSIHKTVNIHAPIRDVFSHFQNIDQFPTFLKSLSIIETVRNKSLQWEQPAHSLFQIKGDARFFEVDSLNTKIEIHFSYHPPLGELGHLIAQIFGIDLKRNLEKSLLQIKQILEQVPTTVPKSVQAIG